MLAKKFLLVVVMFFLSPGILIAQEKSPFFSLKNGFSLKLGYHLATGSDFIDYWAVKKEDFSGPGFELAYERDIFKYLALELAGGFYRADQGYNYRSLVFAGDTAKLDTTVTSTYLSLSVKPHFPIGPYFQLYFGGGPDIYYTTGKFRGEYVRGSSRLPIDETDNKFSWGLHALAGTEFIIWKSKDRDGDFRSAVSLLLEYKYSWVPVKKFDEKVIRNINSFAGSSVRSHDYDAGGHLVLIGLRWRF